MNSRIDLELIFDGGSYLNWKTYTKTDGIFLKPLTRSMPPAFFPSSSDGNIFFGIIDLGKLKVSEYEINLAGVDLDETITPSLNNESVGTRNVAITDNCIWSAQSVSSGKIFLKPELITKLEPSVIALDASLGIVSITVDKIRTSSSKLILRERKGKRREIALDPTSIFENKYNFILSSKIWNKMNVQIDGGKAVWDLFITVDSDSKKRTRLKWSGSITNNPRETVRFRATQSWGVLNELFKIRPYWTLDHYLALEVSRFSNPERN